MQVCGEHLRTGAGIRALVINTGNANASTGDDGLKRARSSCDALARALAVAPALMQGLVREAADQSFNRITIDGDTSTNDTVPKLRQRPPLDGRLWA